MSRLPSTVLVLGLAVLLAAPGGSALLAPLASSAATPIVVGYAPGALEAATTLLQAAGATVVDRLDALDALVVTTPLGIGGITALIASGGGAIQYAEPVHATAISGAQWDGAQWDAAQWDGAQWDGNTTRPTPQVVLAWQWGLISTQAPAAWPHETGSASACLVDSGMNAHPDLPAPRATFNAITGTTSVPDDAGHGTHMAGIVAAIRDNSLGVSGVSRAQLLVAKIFDSTGHGQDTDLARAIVWCASQGADVMLLALSVDAPSQLISRAIAYANAHNVVIVVSAGNTGGAVTYPATEPGVIAVSAIDPVNGTPSFSSRGSAVALAAPGVHVLSAIGASAYAYGSGTSQAAAFVAGAAVLIREQRAGLVPASVRAALMSGAHDIGPPGRDDATGAGLLNVPAALLAASHLE